MDNANIFLRHVGDLQYGDVVGANALPNHIRREFLVRLKDVSCFLVDEWLPRLSTSTGATIVIVSMTDTRPHYQACLELWGTPEAVDIARHEICIQIRMGNSLTGDYPYPSMLPLHVSILQRFVPLHQADALFGMHDSLVTLLECYIGAWIEVTPFDIHHIEGGGICPILYSLL
ncbi:hypothetical protein Hdeb2414_s0018g00523991 [Helianthus debilis subsp. tardiflorus]